MTIQMFNAIMATVTNNAVGDDLHNALFDKGFRHRKSEQDSASPNREKHYYAHKDGHNATVNTGPGGTTVTLKHATGVNKAYGHQQFIRKLTNDELDV